MPHFSCRLSETTTPLKHFWEHTIGSDHDILMATLRLVYHNDLTRPYIGYAAGFLLLVYITFEAPFSGMSLNPARSVASAIPARSWTAWIYFAAPISAMLLAVKLFR